MPVGNLVGSGLVSFAAEKPGQPSSFRSCASAVHLKPAHNPRICPFPPSFAHPLFTVNNPQEIASDGCGSPEVRARLWGGVTSVGASLVFLLFRSFVVFPALRGNFGSLSLLPKGESLRTAECKWQVAMVSTVVCQRKFDF